MMPAVSHRLKGLAIGLGLAFGSGATAEGSASGRLCGSVGCAQAALGVQGGLVHGADIASYKHGADTASYKHEA